MLWLYANKKTNSGKQIHDKTGYMVNLYMVYVNIMIKYVTGSSAFLSSFFSDKLKSRHDRNVWHISENYHLNNFNHIQSNSLSLPHGSIIINDVQ